MGKIIIYDFDGTLTPYPITKFEILDKCGLKDGVFDPKIKKLMMDKNDRGIDFYEAIYSAFLEVIAESGYELNDENISLGAETLEYNKGVFGYLEDMDKLGVKSYLLSSGVKVLLEKTKVYKFFSKIYATTFKYDKDIIVGTDYLMSDKKKVDIIKEIMNDNSLDDCRDIVYVGDGLTDLYAMEFVSDNGGTAVFVYLDSNNRELSVARDKDFVSEFLFADYTRGGELYNYMKSLVEK